MTACAAHPSSSGGSVTYLIYLGATALAALHGRQAKTSVTTAMLYLSCFSSLICLSLTGRAGGKGVAVAALWALFQA